MLIGLKELNLQLDSLSSDTKHKFLSDAGLMVEAEAREKCPKRTGELAGSIQSHFVNEESVAVGTNKEYALYVHQGTGIYNVDGKGRTTYWVYVIDGDPSKKGTGKKEPYYTLEEAIRAVAYLRAKGLRAFYTNGQRPQPFLTQALETATPDIMEALKKTIREVTK